MYRYIQYVSRQLRSASSRAVFSSVLLAALQGVTGLLTAAWLGPHDRGVVVIALSTSSLLLLVAGLGLNNSARALLADASSGITITNFQRAVLIIVLAEAIPIALAAATILRFIGKTQDCVVLSVFAAYCIFMTLGAIYREALHGLGWHSWAILCDVSAAAILFGASAALHATGNLSVRGIVVALLIGSVTQCLLACTLGLWKGPHRGTRNLTVMELLRYTRPGLGLTLGQWLAWKGDRLILGLVSDPAAVGVYGFVSTLVDIPWVIPGATSAVLMRRVGQGAKREEVERRRRHTVVATFAVAAIVAAFAIPVIPHFPGEAYASGVPALLILVPASLSLTSAQMDLSACVGFGDLRSGARATLMAALFMLIGAPILGWRLGATGCAIASLLAYTIMAVKARDALNPHLRTR